MNIKELCKRAGITYPTMRAFLNGYDKMKLSSFKSLLGDADKIAFEAMSERTKNRIKRESGRWSK